MSNSLSRVDLSHIFRSYWGVSPETLLEVSSVFFSLVDRQCFLACSDGKLTSYRLSQLTAVRFHAPYLLHLLMVSQFCPDDECVGLVKNEYESTVSGFDRAIKQVREGPVCLFLLKTFFFFQARALEFSYVDRLVGIVGASFASVFIAAMLVVVGFLLIRKALFVSGLFLSLLLFNVIESALLLAFSVCVLVGRESVVFDRLLPLLIALLEIWSILLFLRFYLDAISEVMASKWNMPVTLNVGIAVLAAVAAGLTVAAGWAVSLNAEDVFLSDLDELQAAALVCALIGFGLVITGVLLFFSVQG
jgi:hypothetical protein